MDRNEPGYPETSGIVVEPHLVAARLRELHPTLSQQPLVEALEAGSAERAQCTPHHGASYPGSKMHYESVARLRDILVPRGWSTGSTSNYETTVTPDGAIAIAVAGGDEATGNPYRMPTTKHAKGLVTRQVVRRNYQASLVFDPDYAEQNTRIFAKDVPDEATETTWILLHSTFDGTLRCELSMPTEIDLSGRIFSWQVRLILGEFPLGEGALALPVDQAADPVVEVHRRVS